MFINFKHKWNHASHQNAGNDKYKENIGGEIFQIATNKETTVNKIGELLISYASTKGINNIEIKNAKFRLGDVKRNFSDTTKAKKNLGWQAETDLSVGIGHTFEWFLTVDSKRRE